MRHVIHTPFYSFRNRIWRVNADDKHGLRTDILRALLGQIDAMLSHHRKLFVYRFDLHLHANTTTNKIITDLNRPLFKRIKSKYKVARIGYGWVREIEKAKPQHYHYMLLIDGSKINYPETLQVWIKEIWHSLDGASIHWAGYHQVERKGEASIHEASHHISYLAKPRGKGYKPTQTKDYRTSNLKPR